MSLYVKLYRDVSNPLGFPSDYPAEAVESKVVLDPPWIEISKEDYLALINKNRALVVNIIEQAKVSTDATKEQKTSSLLATFDELQAIKDKFVGAGKLEATEQLDLSIHILNAVLALREPLLEIQKRNS